MIANTHVIDDAYVRAELREAFATLDSLPENARPPGMRLMNSPRTPRAQDVIPTVAQVTAMDRALEWLELLQDRDVRLAVQLRAQGASDRQAAKMIGGISAPTIPRREARGIAVIVAGLRGMRMVPGFDTLARRGA